MAFSTEIKWLSPVARNNFFVYTSNWISSHCYSHLGGYEKVSLTPWVLFLLGFHFCYFWCKSKSQLVKTWPRARLSLFSIPIRSVPPLWPGPLLLAPILTHFGRHRNPIYSLPSLSSDMRRWIHTNMSGSCSTLDLSYWSCRDKLLGTAVAQ